MKIKQIASNMTELKKKTEQEYSFHMKRPLPGGMTREPLGRLNIGAVQQLGT